MKKINVYGQHLKNLKVAFMVLDNINSYKAPKLISELREFSCEIYPYVSSNHLRYVTQDILKWSSGNNIEFLDKEYDAVIIYPVTKNFINKVLNKTIKNDKINNLINNETQVILLSDEVLL